MVRILLYCIISLLLAGCSKEKSTQYRIVKEEKKVEDTSFQQNSQEIIGLEAQTEFFKKPLWEVPKDWSEQPLGKMRKGSFIVKNAEGHEAEITVLAFPGDVGGKLANINRWAEQISAPIWSENSLKNISSIEAGNIRGNYIELTGPEKSILAVIIEHNNASWFFKIMGESNLVTLEKENFRHFVQSVKFDD